MLKGQKASLETREKMSQAMLGRSPWNKGIADNLTHKTCTKCKKIKSIDNFYRKRKDSQIRVPYCKECQSKMCYKYRSTKNGKEVIRNHFRKRYKIKKNEYIKKAMKRFLEKPEAIKAEAKARYAIRKGILVKKPCEKCGNLKSEMHHDDYLKPIEVRWLCRSCHVIEHNNS